MSVVRHIKVFADAWRAESKRRHTARRAWEDTDFLPAALEVTETPPSPVGRAILWLVIAAAATALAWSYFSKVDTVAVAEGRLVPAGRLRSVEAAEGGVIRAINVHEGQHVVAGQALIALDATMANADAQSAQTELSTAGLTRARANALMAYADGGDYRLAAPRVSDAGARAAERQLIEARVDEYAAKRASLEERRRAAEATVAMAQANVEKLAQTIPLAAKQLAAYQRLAEQGYGSRLRSLQEQERLVNMRQELIAEQARLAESQAQVSSLTRDIAAAEGEFRSQAARERADAEGVVATRGDALRKARQRQGMQTLTAPVSGVVQEVSVSTLGAVAEAGKPLITIVPDGEDLVVEALVLNRDVGFVHPGAHVVVKLEAYPFNRYGTLSGTLQRVSPDAIVDEQRGLVFPARVKLSKNVLKVDGRPILLSAGMGAVAEIVTGRRRVIEYLWSPVAKAVREAGRER